MCVSVCVCVCVCMCVCSVCMIVSLYDFISPILYGSSPSSASPSSSSSYGVSRIWFGVWGTRCWVLGFGISFLVGWHSIVSKRERGLGVTGRGFVCIVLVGLIIGMAVYGVDLLGRSSLRYVRWVSLVGGLIISLTSYLENVRHRVVSISGSYVQLPNLNLDRWKRWGVWLGGWLCGWFGGWGWILSHLYLIEIEAIVFATLIMGPIVVMRLLALLSQIMDSIFYYLGQRFLDEEEYTLSSFLTALPNLCGQIESARHIQSITPHHPELRCSVKTITIVPIGSVPLRYLYSTIIFLLDKCPPHIIDTNHWSNSISNRKHNLLYVLSDTHTSEYQRLHISHHKSFNITKITPAHGLLSHQYELQYNTLHSKFTTTSHIIPR